MVTNARHIYSMYTLELERNISLQALVFLDLLLSPSNCLSSQHYAHATIGGVMENSYLLIDSRHPLIDHHLFFISLFWICEP